MVVSDIRLRASYTNELLHRLGGSGVICGCSIVASARALGQILREVGQGSRVGQKRLEGVERGGVEAFNFGPRTFDAKHGGVGEFAGVGVFVGALARVFGGLGDVEEVVDDLEHEADGLGIGGDGGEAKIARVEGGGAHGPHAAGGADQGTGLVDVDEAELLDRCEVRGQARASVPDLARDHGAGGRGEFAEQREAQRGLGGVELGEPSSGFGRIEGREGKEFEGPGEEGVAGEDGQGFAGVFVERGSSTSNVVVVDRGQVVMHERKGVDEFEREARGEGTFAGGAHRFAGVPREQGAEAFAGTKGRVFDGFEERDGLARRAWREFTDERVFNHAERGEERPPLLGVDCLGGGWGGIGGGGRHRRKGRFRGVGPAPVGREGREITAGCTIFERG